MAVSRTGKSKAKSSSGRKPPRGTAAPGPNPSSPPGTQRNSSKAKPDERQMELEQKLLAIGGTEVVWPPERVRDLSLLLVRGRPFDEKVRLRRGDRDQPHANVAKLWGQFFDAYHVATGYALDEAGRWVRHSWLMDGENPERGASLLETTHRRAAYFGYTLAHFEAITFWVRHFLWGWGAAPLKVFYGTGTLDDLNRFLDRGRFGPGGGAQSGDAQGARR
jgi:hypothetical protein